MSATVARGLRPATSRWLEAQRESGMIHDPPYDLAKARRLYKTSRALLPIVLLLLVGTALARGWNVFLGPPAKRGYGLRAMEEEGARLGEQLALDVMLAVAGVLSCALWLVGQWSSRRARQWTAKGAIERLRVHGAFAFYFRSFDCDAQSALMGTGDEERIAKELVGHATLVAIGDPREPLPRLGALRLYAKREAWQELARRLAADARFVIFRPGVSSGVQFERALCLRNVPLDRLVIYTTPQDRHGYEALRADAASLGIGMPADPPRVLTFSDGGDTVGAPSLLALLGHLRRERRQRAADTAEE